MEFAEYMRNSRDGASPENAIVVCHAISHFALYEKGKNESFSLARLSSLDLLPLPRPWDWLERIGEGREEALDGYSNLLEFLEELLERHGPRHMSLPEKEFRRRHLRAIENELWADNQARK